MFLCELKLTNGLNSFANRDFSKLHGLFLIFLNKTLSEKMQTCIRTKLYNAFIHQTLGYSLLTFSNPTSTVTVRTNFKLVFFLFNFFQLLYFYSILFCGFMTPEKKNLILSNIKNDDIFLLVAAAEIGA